MLNIHSGQKNRLFFEKVGVFLPPAGPNARNFCPETLASMLLKKQQKLPISATNVVFGFRSIFKGLLSEFVEENRGFEGRNLFA